MAAKQETCLGGGEGVGCGHGPGPAVTVSRPALWRFLIWVASQNHCGEDNTTTEEHNAAISVTGREEVLEHVLILPGLGGWGWGTLTLS